MKILKFSSLIVLLGALFFSCQKEYSLENVVTPAGSWQFNDAAKLYAGNIDTAYIETTGTTKVLYLIGKSADGQQSFLLNLYTIDSFRLGTYRVSLFETDFLYLSQAKTFYQADGLTAVTNGEFTVTITALGNNSISGTFSGDSEDSTGAVKPLTLGKFTSRINLSANGTGGGGTGSAIGTLGALAGVCTQTTFAGSFTQGVALTSANTATVQVNVATAGTYTISTNTVNGVTFSASGTFTTTGPQNVVLAGSGTPVSSGNQTFAVTFGASTCNFVINFLPGAGAATGTLGGAPGTCTSATPAGTYTQGITLTAANTVTVQVNVATTGSYAIATGAVNGVAFTGTGTFTTTGVQNVVLQGSGTPISSGNQTYAVTFGTSTCNFVINYGAGAGPATGTLGGSPGSCTSFTTAGTYTQGVPLTAANTVQIQVNVATLGSYTISSNTVNGVSFSKSGTFTSTGLQTLILTGTGTPTNSGSQNFTVTFGSSSCTFSITFAPGTAPVGDYFPTTINSYWDYGKDGGVPSDSFRIKVNPATKSAGGNSYIVFTLDDIPASGAPDSLFYRKGSGLYYEYFNTEDYFGFDPGSTSPPNIEYIFLKDNVPVGTTWQSQTFSGDQGGTTYNVYMKMTLFAKITTPITVGSVTSSDVLKVRYEYFVTTFPGSPFLTEERWFAKGVGMIYNTFTDGTNTDTYRIGGFQVF